MYTVINHGFRRAIPTANGEISLPHGIPIRFGDSERGVVDVIRRYPYIEVKGDSKLNSLKIWELRKLATKYGIKGSFFMKKSELVKKLEEKNAR